MCESILSLHTPLDTGISGSSRGGRLIFQLIHSLLCKYKKCIDKGQWTPPTHPPLSMKFKPANTHGRYMACKKWFKSTYSYRTVFGIKIVRASYKLLYFYYKHNIKRFKTKLVFVQVTCRQFLLQLQGTALFLTTVAVHYYLPHEYSLWLYHVFAQKFQGGDQIILCKVNRRCYIERLLTCIDCTENSTDIN